MDTFFRELKLLFFTIFTQLLSQLYLYSQSFDPWCCYLHNVSAKESTIILEHLQKTNSGKSIPHTALDFYFFSLLSSCGASMYVDGKTHPLEHRQTVWRFCSHSYFISQKLHRCVYWCVFLVNKTKVFSLSLARRSINELKIDATVHLNICRIIFLSNIKKKWRMNLLKVWSLSTWSSG